MSNVPFEELFFSKTMDFLNIYLIKQAGRSTHTGKAYKNALRQFYEYIHDVKKVSPMAFRFSDCTYQLVLEFSQYMQSELKYKQITVNQKLAAIKSYLKYVSDGDFALVQVYLSVNKVPELPVPKTQGPVMEMDVLSKYLDSPPHTKIGNRDRMILILLFDTAVRVSELVGITLGGYYPGCEKSGHPHSRKRPQREISDGIRYGFKTFESVYQCIS